MPRHAFNFPFLHRLDMLRHGQVMPRHVGLWILASNFLMMRHDKTMSQYALLLCPNVLRLTLNRSNLLVLWSSSSNITWKPITHVKVHKMVINNAKTQVCKGKIHAYLTFINSSTLSFLLVLKQNRLRTLFILTNLLTTPNYLHFRRILGGT